METKKIIVNACFGGFGLSKAAFKAFTQAKGITQMKKDDVLWILDRSDPILVDIVERMGDAANGEYSKLVIIEIPADVDWQIGEYDGYEQVEERHMVWTANDC